MPGRIRAVVDSLPGLALMLAPILGFAAEFHYAQLAPQRRRIALAVVAVLIAGGVVASNSAWSLVGVLPDHLWTIATAAAVAMLVWRVVRIPSKVLRWAAIAAALLLFSSFEIVGYLLLCFGGLTNVHVRAGWLGFTHTYEVRSYGGTLAHRNLLLVYLSSTPAWCPLVERGFAEVVLPWKNEDPNDLTVTLGENDGEGVAEIRLDGALREAVALR